MKCVNCGRDNPAESKYCSGCGQPLAQQIPDSQKPSGATQAEKYAAKSAGKKRRIAALCGVWSVALLALLILLFCRHNEKNDLLQSAGKEPPFSRNPEETAEGDGSRLDNDHSASSPQNSEPTSVSSGKAEEKPEDHGESTSIYSESGEMTELTTSSTYDESNILDSGTCGDNLSWQLDSSGTLTISGSGAMWDYDSEQPNKSPWSTSADKIGRLVIYDGVTYIGTWAFQELRNLKRVDIPASVTLVGWGAFGKCTGLEEVYITEGLQSLSGSVFIECSSLKKVALPSSLESIGMFAFCACEAMTEVVIPKNVTSIGEGAFSNCTGLQRIIVAEGNQRFAVDSQGVLMDMSQTTVYACPADNRSCAVPEGVSDIMPYALLGCKRLEEITLPGTLRNIGLSAFAGCIALRDIEIPNGVACIPQSAFRGCTALTTVLLPESVTEIGWCAFEECVSLKAIYFCGDMPVIDEEAFVVFKDNGTASSSLYVTLYYVKGKNGWPASYWNGYPTATWDGPR